MKGRGTHAGRLASLLLETVIVVDFRRVRWLGFR
jgi:hypothetical protein